MSKIITIAGQKGGIGKSVTAVNLAASFALSEKKTLLVDCDPQGSSTRWCGIKDEDHSSDMASVLSARATVAHAINKTLLNYLDIIPAGFTLFQASLKIAENPGNEKLLRLFLKDVDDKYEYIIIDPPSSYGFLSAAAMTASDFLLVCMSVKQNSREDFHNLLKMVKFIRSNYSVSLKISGFLFTQCQSKEEIISFLDNHDLLKIQQMVFTSFIPEDIKIKESNDLRKPLLLYDIKSKAAKAYLNLAGELHSFLN